MVEQPIERWKTEEARMKVEEAQRVLRETAEPRDDLPHPVGSNIADALRLLVEAETLLK